MPSNKVKSFSFSYVISFFPSFSCLSFPKKTISPGPWKKKKEKQEEVLWDFFVGNRISQKISRIFHKMHKVFWSLVGLPKLGTGLPTYKFTKSPTYKLRDRQLRESMCQILLSPSDNILILSNLWKTLFINSHINLTSNIKLSQYFFINLN